MKKIAFYLGFGALLTHEMDAMTNHEWRVMPILRSLPDEMGMVIFVALHVPIFAVLIALVASPKQRTQVLTRVMISAFLLIHALLHLSFSAHPAYEFSAPLSSMLIYGGALFGGVYLAMEAKDKYARAA